MPASSHNSPTNLPWGREPVLSLPGLFVRIRARYHFRTSRAKYEALPLPQRTSSNPTISPVSSLLMNHRISEMRLPHVHLLLFFCCDDRYLDMDCTDQIIYAELPDTEMHTNTGLKDGCWDLTDDSGTTGSLPQNAARIIPVGLRRPQFKRMDIPYRCRIDGNLGGLDERRPSFHL